MSLPHRPNMVSPYAEACLTALADSKYGRCISIGGAFGLAHYFEYRESRDVDARWAESTTSAEREATVTILEQALKPFGEVSRRSWGDVVSVELKIEHSTVFSFQIAQRSAEIEPPVPDVWPGGIGLDSFRDLVASKMVALVERGAPRDFLDIYTLCTHRQCSVSDCWLWWESRQMLARESIERKRAILALRTHLARLERVRPLTEIHDAEQREAAKALRAWFEQEFLGELSN